MVAPRFWQRLLTQFNLSHGGHEKLILVDGRGEFVGSTRTIQLATCLHDTLSRRWSPHSR